jgi:ferric-dicitrate binding protein FerR (iron transport regulator)
VTNENQGEPEEHWDDLFEYFDGRCAPEMVAAIERWIQNDPSIARRVEQAYAQWLRLGRVASPLEKIDTLASLRQLQRRREAIELAPARRVVSGQTGVALTESQRRAVRTAAAAVIAVLGVGAALQITDGGSWLADRLSPPLSIAYTTSRGECRSFTLSDGTAITLAPDTRLVVTSRVGAGPRKLSLAGEAYFVVAHNAQRPLTVRAGNAVTEDVGTRFSVRAYPGDASVRVVVAEGSVFLRDTASREQHRRLLTPGTEGAVSEAGITTVTGGINADLLLGWRDGQLRFPGTPLGIAVQDLDRWYDIDIVLADSTLATLPVRGSLPTASVTTALDAIARVTESRWVRKGHTVTFVRAGHASANNSADKR